MRDITQREILAFRLAEGSPVSVAWSPDGTRLVVGDDRGGVGVCTAEGVWLWQRVEHSDSVNCVSWSPDGRHIASASDDHTVRMWEAATGQFLLRYAIVHLNILSVSWSPDSRFLAYDAEEAYCGSVPCPD